MAVQIIAENRLLPLGIPGTVNAVCANATGLARAPTVTATGGPVAPTPIPFSSTEILNPLRGQYIDIGIGLKAGWPGTQDYGLRFPWRDIEPTIGNYNFAPIDNMINSQAANGRRCWFRIMTWSEFQNTISGLNNNLPTNIPSSAYTDWVQGATTYRIPNWNDPNYVNNYLNTIAALGARYDSDERVSWVEVSFMGDYGENHTQVSSRIAGNNQGPTGAAALSQLGYASCYGDHITQATWTSSLNAHFSAFPKTRLICVCACGESIRQCLAAPVAKKIGLRGDSFGNYPFMSPNFESCGSWSSSPTYQAALNQWKVAPNICEWYPGLTGTALDNQFTKGLTDGINRHLSLIASNNVAPPAGTDTSNFTRCCKYAGYRYAPAASISGNNVTVTWWNYGVAPVYERWDIVYEVLNNLGSVVQTVNSAFKLNNVYAPSQNWVYDQGDPTPGNSSDAFVLNSLPAGSGTYTIRTRVVWNEHKAGGTHVWNFAPMNLAITGRDSAGNYNLASFTR